MPTRSVCLVTLFLSEQGPGRVGHPSSSADICHTMPPPYAVHLYHPAVAIEGGRPTVPAPEYNTIDNFLTFTRRVL